MFSAFRVQKVLVFTALSAFFALLPKKTLTRKNAVISKTQKSPKKRGKTAPFSDFRYPQNGGGNALGDAYERPGFRPKSFPPAEWRILGVFWGPASEGRRFGARLTIELWDARNAFVSILVWSRRSRTFGGLKTTLTTLVNPSTSISNNLFCLLLAWPTFRGGIGGQWVAIITLMFEL